VDAGILLPDRRRIILPDLHADEKVIVHIRYAP